MLLLKKYANLCDRSWRDAVHDAEQAAERYQVSPDTLKEWQHKGVEPNYPADRRERSRGRLPRRQQPEGCPGRRWISVGASMTDPTI
jgi:hypothetical protein